MAEKTNKIKLFALIGILILTFISLSYIASADFATMWNPWTNRLDYIRGTTLDDNMNITGNLTVHGGLLVQEAPAVTDIANLTLLDVINGTYAVANLSLLTIDINTSYTLNASRVTTELFWVYAANSSTALTLVESDDYTLNDNNGTWLMTENDWDDFNITVDYSKRTIYDFNATNLVDVRVYAAIKNGSLTPLTLLNVSDHYTAGLNTGKFELIDFAWNGSNITLDYDRIDYINVLPGHAYFEENITYNWATGGLNWTNLDLYPAACPTGYYLTQIADETTCMAVNQTFGNFNVTGNITTYMIRGQDLKPLAIGNWSASNSLDSHNDLGVKGDFEVDGISYFDGITYLDSSVYVDNIVPLYFGAGGYAHLMWNTYQTNNDLTLSLDSLSSKSLLICEAGDYVTNYGHEAQSNPTIFIQSGDETQIAEWVSLTYNNKTAQSILSNGAGDMNVSAVENVTFSSGGGYVNFNGNVTINGNLAISYNSTCHFFYSPAGTGILEVCD